MTPIVLIAANFLRQHRWPVLLLFGWILLTAAAAGNFGRGRPVPADVIFHAQQQSIYICIFSAFLSADAIHGERKSRRILLLLSKAVSRAEYLLAIASAVMAMAVAYALLSAICGVWLSANGMVSSAALWPLCVLVIATALISATATMFFATFLNPYIATACTLAMFSAPMTLHAYRHPWSAWWPGLPLFMQFLHFGVHGEWSPNWSTVFAAVVESVLFFVAAAIVFERRDIAVPVE